MAVYEAVVWFLVGSFVAGGGAAVGSVGGLWTGWALSVLVSGAVAWSVRRLPLVVGAAVVSATLGALTSNSWEVTVVLAFWSVAVPATALLPFGVWRLFSRRSSLRPLRERDISLFLRLAERDPEQFHKRLRSLTPSQREQIRRVLRSRRVG